MALTLEQSWMRHLETVRWFGGKGAGASLTRLEPLAFHTPPGSIPAVRSEVATLSYPDGRTEHYHLVAALYPDGATPDAAVVWTGEVPGLGEAVVVDATTDPDAVDAFVVGTQSLAIGMEWRRDLAPLEAQPVRVFAGEQSNTTLLLGEDALFKLFRKIEPGPNLDTEVLLALGGESTPAVYGRLTGAWPVGHWTDLGVVMERIPGAADGWELACAACVAGRDFTDEAFALGRALAAVHARLREAFGHEVRAGDEVAASMNARLDAALAQAPVLAGHAASLRPAFGALRGTTLEVQRVHGDFHLGQTLASPAGWTIIDFEGEPAKSAAERRAFDSVWRDVAGMVRSFDYARSAHAEPASATATNWADRARTAFLKGYCGGTEANEGVLTGYVIDKAVYEVVYELRNRPDWVGIPLRAIREASRQTTTQDTSDKE